MMKYRQLSKEQFLELHSEFSKFLATQQIDVKEWEQIKKEKPEVAEEELNIFSDVVWEEVLSKTNYLEHISEHHINLFKCNLEKISAHQTRLASAQPWLRFRCASSRTRARHRGFQPAT